jgi:hypothetical protein
MNMSGNNDFAAVKSEKSKVSTPCIFAKVICVAFGSLSDEELDDESAGGVRGGVTGEIGIELDDDELDDDELDDELEDVELNDVELDDDELIAGFAGAFAAGSVTVIAAVVTFSACNSVVSFSAEELEELGASSTFAFLIFGSPPLGFVLFVCRGILRAGCNEVSNDSIPLGCELVIKVGCFTTVSITDLQPGLFNFRHSVFLPIAQK